MIDLKLVLFQVSIRMYQTVFLARETLSLCIYSLIVNKYQDFVLSMDRNCTDNEMINGVLDQIYLNCISHIEKPIQVFREIPLLGN